MSKLLIMFLDLVLVLGLGYVVVRFLARKFHQFRQSICQECHNIVWEKGDAVICKKCGNLHVRV